MNTARALLASAALAGACAAPPATAADYPDRPVKVIVAFSPGGTTDTLTRSVTNTLTQKLGQPSSSRTNPARAATSAPNTWCGRRPTAIR